jgi:hypothetical protein
MARSAFAITSRFDSARLRTLLAEQVQGVPIFDVMHPEYLGAQPAAHR